jgi:nucleotide-binding universal stress UspA family protein
MRPLLICYDGSAAAESAIDVAAAILKPSPAIVLNVAPPLTVAESLATMNSVVSSAAAFEGVNEADALRRARAGARRAREAGLDAETRVRVAAPPWEGIVEAADEADAAVIVIGSRARSRLREFAEGGVSHEVAAHAGRPILIVPRAARATTGPILICYDGSEQARKAIETAGALVRSREAVVLDAAPLRVSVGYSAWLAEAPWVDAADATVKFQGAEAGAEVARRAGFDAVATTHSARTTRRAIGDIADEVDASVIVVGSRGLKGVREDVERSVSRDVASHVHRPVLVVPPDPKPREPLAGA